MHNAVECRHCKSRFAAAEHLFGKTVPCPTCQTFLEIPDFNAPQALDAQPGQQPLSNNHADALGQQSGMPAEASTPAAQAAVNFLADPSKRMYVIAGGIGIGLLCLAVAIFILGSFFFGPSTPTVAENDPHANAPGTPTQQPEVRNFGRSTPSRPSASTSRPSSPSNAQLTGTPTNRSVSPTPAVGTNAQTNSPSPVATWQVKPDPILPSQLGSSTNISIPVSRDSKDSVLYSTTGNRWVGVVQHFTKGQKLELWDLSSGTLQHQLDFGFEATAFLGNSVISPDGRYLAAPRYENGSRLSVWSFEQGARLHDLPMAGVKTPIVHFGPQDTVLALTESGSTMTLVAWSLKTGQQLYTKSIKGDGDWCMAVSPAHRYLALLSAGLRVIDLETGNVAGTTNYSEKWECSRAAFSSDGKRLGTVMGTRYGNCKFVTFDMTSGAIQTVGNEVRLRDLLGYRTIRGSKHSIEWLEGDTAWLLDGTAVVDIKQGAKLWTLPESMQCSSRRRLVGANRVLTVDAKLTQKALIGVSIPGGLGAQAQAIADGGEAVDTQLPKLTSVPSQQVQPLLLNAQPWPSDFRLLAAPPLPRLSRLVSMGNEPIGNCIAAQGTPIAAATRTVHGSSSVFLDSYNLTSGERLNRLDLPNPTVLLDVSPDGRWAITSIGKNRTRLDIWELATANHAIAFRPYATTEGTSSSAKSVSYARFLSTDHVLTYSAYSKTVEVWSVPDLRVVYSVSGVVSAPALTPARDCVVVMRDRDLFFLDALTGTLRGGIELGDRMGRGQVAFSPDLSRMAHLSTAGYAAFHVRIFDLTSGAVIQDLGGPRRVNQIHWASNNHLLTISHHNWVLMDVTRGVGVWTYRSSYARVLETLFSGQIAVSSSGTRSRGQSFVAGLTLPGSNELAAIAKHLPEGPAPVLYGPGSTVGLTVQVAGNAAEVRAKLESKLQSLGIGIGSGSINLVARTSPGKSRTEAYGDSIFGFARSADFTISVPASVCTVELVDATTNAVLWKHEQEVRGHTASSIRDTSDAQSKLRQQASDTHRQGITSFFSGIALPHIMRNEPYHGDSDYDVGVGATVIDSMLRNPALVPATRTVGAGRRPTNSTASKSVSVGPHAALLFNEYKNLLTGDGSGLRQRMRWYPGGKRPVIGLRWGLGIVLKGTAAPRISSERDFDKYTGEVGAALVQNLQRRLSSGKYGTWPVVDDKTDFGQLSFIGTSDNPKSLESRGKARALDVLAVLDLTAKNRSSATLRVRIVDLHGQLDVLATRALSTSSFQPGQGVSTVEELFQRADPVYLLKAMPTITQPIAKQRVNHLASDANSHKHMLWVLAEMKYYQALGHVSELELAVELAKLIDESTAKAITMGNPTQRRSELQKLLEKTLQ